MRRGFWTTILSCACVALLTLPATAGAAIEVESFSFGLSTAQAGAHPDATVEVSFAKPGEPETARDAVVGLPRGLFLYPWTLPRCLPQQLAADECPISSQVGVVDVHAASLGDLGKAPVYLAAPGPDELARLVFSSIGFAEPVEVPVRASAANGYSLSLSLEDLPEAMPVASFELSLWGVPPAPSHDDERGPDAPVPGGRPAGIPMYPFTRNPTACGATGATLLARSYEDAEGLTAASASGPTITGCGKLSFEPATAVGLTTTEAASTTGLGFDNQLPQDLSPNALATSDTEALALYLQGLGVDEAAASSRATCTPAEANLFNEDPAACPPASRIGSFAGSLAGTDVDEVLEGGVYFGGLEAPGEYLLFLVASGAGLELKLPAWLVAGSEAELVIPELPQLPLEELDLQFDPAASLFLTPPTCGTFAAVTEAIGWSQPDLASVASTPFTVASGPGGGPCLAPRTGQNSPSPTTAPAAAAPKPTLTVKLLKHPPHRGRDRTPTFRFTSNLPGSSFKCKIDRRAWRPCRSPLTLRKLGLGNHTFGVKAHAVGAASSTLSFRFVIAP
jgi:hypothetical protein